MLKIAICDDEYITAEHYYKQISEIFKNSDTACELDLFTDSGKLLASLYSGSRWDIYFLDIDMPLVNGLDLGQKIREFDINCYLIYVSIRCECVYDSLRTKPFRFIPKDQFQSMIGDCIQDLLADMNTESENEFVTFENRTAIYRFPISDIVYVQSTDKYISLSLKNHTQTESIRFRMSDIEQQLLPHGFIRIHKSYLVNYRYIRSIQSSYILLDDKTQLPVSRYRLEDIKTTFRRLTL